MPQLPTAPSPQTDRVKTEISVARIGLMSAVVVAACGLIGTLMTVFGTAINAYFSSQAVRAPIVIPLNATQTAEARMGKPTAQPGTGLPTAGSETQTVSLLVDNHLVLPIRIFFDGSLQGEVAARSEGSFPLDHSDVKVEWDLVKETTAGGRKLGPDVSGSFASANPGDLLNVDNVVSEQAYFYPFITNNTEQDCEVIVNKGWKSEVITDAVVPALSKDVGLGYYKLFENSNLTLECGEKEYWWGTLPDETDPDSFLDEVEAGSGVVHFTLDP